MWFTDNATVTFYPFFFSNVCGGVFCPLKAVPLSFAAFTITAPKDLYVVEYGSNVTMECRFPVEQKLDLLALVVYWEKEDKEVIQFVEGEEDLKPQHSSFRGRAFLPKDQLLKGNAVLQITDVKLQDAGVYCCMISYGGADYKRITLKVNGKNYPGWGSLHLYLKHLPKVGRHSFLEVHTHFSQHGSSLFPLVRSFVHTLQPWKHLALVCLTATWDSVPDDTQPCPAVP